MPVTNTFLAGSAGVNPVLTRNIIDKLKASSTIDIAKGKSGIKLAKPLAGITFYDVYQAVGYTPEKGLFHLHVKPDFNCPVWRNIHMLADNKLERIRQAMQNEMKCIMLESLQAEAKNM